jgi:hypothetical protein
MSKVRKETFTFVNTTDSAEGNMVFVTSTVVAASRIVPVSAAT